MAEPLVAELQLDIQPALEALPPLSDALTNIANDFSQALADAISSIGSATTTIQPIDTSTLIDANEISNTIDSAITNVVPPPIPVQADTTDIDTAIADALDAPRDPIPVDGDTTALTQSIDAATASAPPVVVPVSADISDAIASLQEISNTPLQIEADTSDAQAAIDDLGNTASEAASGVDGLSSASDALKISTELASGETGALAEGIGLLSPKTAEAGAGILALGAFIGKSVQIAADAQAQNERFNATFGAMATAVQNIHFEGAKQEIVSLEEVARITGTTFTDLQASASKIGELGNSVGEAPAKIAETADKVLALGATLSVTNPRLGNAAQVTDTLSRLLAVGGQRLANYGIGLTQVQIRQEAMTESGVKSANELTRFQLLTAGATLATQQFGSKLGLEFEAGSQNAQIQLRALGTAIEETIGKIGQPLLQPVITFFAELLPAAESLSKVLGAVAADLLPIFGVIGAAVAPLTGLLNFLADGLKEIGPLGFAAAVGLAVIGPAAVEAGGGMFIAATASEALAGALALLGNPIVLAALAIAAIGAIFDSLNAESKAAADESKAFNQTLIDTSGTASGIYAPGIKTATEALAAYIKTQQDAGKEKTLTDALNRAHSSVDALTQAASAGGQEWEDYKKHVESAQTLGFATFGGGIQAIEQQRQALKDSTEQITENAVAQAQLTQKQLDGIIAANGGAGANENYGAVLDAVNKQVEANTAALNAQTQAAPGYAAAVKDISDQIEAGTITTQDALEVEKALGLSQSDATQFITQNAKATADLKDTQILATPAAKLLAQQYETGAINALQYRDALTVLHVSQTGITGAQADGLKTQKDYTQAISDAADKTTLLSPAVANLTIAFQAGTITQNEFEKGLIQLGLSVPAAEKAISDATTALNNFVSGVIGALPTAKDALSTFTQQAQADFQQLSTDAKNGTGNVKADLATLATDNSPAKFTANLNAQTVAIASFAANIQRLVKEGFGSLAEFLAQQGPVAAGKLAEGFASSPSQAKAGEAAFTLSNAVTTNVSAQLKKDFPQIAAEIGSDTSWAAAGTAAAANFTGTLNFGLTGASGGGITAAAFAHRAQVESSAVTDAARTAAQDAETAFDSAYTPAASAKKNTEAAGPAIKGAEKPGTDAATAAGKDAADAYGKGADFAGQVVKNLALVPAAFAGAVGPIAATTTAEGTTAGINFDAGIVAGMTAPSQILAVTNAGATVAQAAAAGAQGPKGFKSKSPSLVGKKIGQDFIGGMIVGFNDPATVGAAITTLEHLVAQFTATTAAGLTGTFAALPTVGTQISTFQQGVSTALDKVHSDQARATADTHTLEAAQKALVPAYGAAVTASQKAAAANAVVAAIQAQIANAKSTVSVGVKVSADPGNAAAIAHDLAIIKSGVAGAPDTPAIQEARIDLENRTTAATKSHGAAVSNLTALQAQLTEAQKVATAATQAATQADNAAVTANTRLTDAKKNLHAAEVQEAADKKALAVATAPQTFINQVNTATAQGREFQKNLQKLIKDGDKALAEQLAQAGVASAGVLAEKLADHPAKAKIANAAVVAAASFSASFQKFLTDEFAPQATNTIATIGTAAAAAFKTSIATPISNLVPGARTALLGPTVGPAVGPLSAPAVGPSVLSGNSTLQLHLDITLPDGTRAQADTITLSVPKATGNTKTQLKANVRARAIA